MTSGGLVPELAVVTAALQHLKVLQLNGRLHVVCVACHVVTGKGHTRECRIADALKAAVAMSADAAKWRATQ